MVSKYKSLIRSVLFSTIIFCILFIGVHRYTNYKQGQWEKDIRSQLLELLIGKKSKLEKALYSRIYYTKGVASFVSLNPDITNKEFDLLAGDLIQGDPIISSMALSKNCVIGAIYPREGHEAAIGLDLLAHPERVEIVDKTIETRKTFVAGPVELVEGGVAFISYTPIFDKTLIDSGVFWGVTDIAIRLEGLMDEAELYTNEAEYEFALRGYNGQGENGAVFFGKEALYDRNPVKVDISLPYGNWVLAAAPIIGWANFYDQDKFMNISLFISAIIISFLIGLVIYSILKIQTNEKKLKAIFGSLDSLIVEISDQGNYISIAPTKLNLLVKPSQEMVGKNVNDLFEPELAKKFMKAIQECISKKRLVIIEYPLINSGKEKWYQGRISYRNEKAVIFNVIDITSIKEFQNSIQKSNAMKDKLFSVLAHDLRNPLGAFEGLTKQMINNFSTFSETEITNKLNLMQSASKSLYTLLEDILEWQLLQTSAENTENEPINLNSICNQVIQIHDNAAKNKQIKIVNNIPTTATAMGNSRMYSSILRNLLSNAIKYSNVGDEVNVFCEFVDVNGKNYVAISVSDNGVGIAPEKVASFQNDGQILSTEGTLNEKGTGFGLMLCKDFIESQGGKLSLKSEVGIGSTFTFTLNAK